MPETTEGAIPPSPEEILAGIQTGLRSEDAPTRLRAIQELDEQNFSSIAILRRLENLALKDKSKAVREAALQALSSPTHSYIRRRASGLKAGERKFILAEIAQWEAQGLISADQGEVLRQRYDFERKSFTTSETFTSSQTAPRPAPAKIEKPSSQDATPRPGLSQTLLSETSIKIALYLGAFFVVAAAAILAALVEAARLPILLAATALFAGGAILTRRRLAQPSFALFIVFSFLLPTDANVLADVLDLPDLTNAGYWFMSLVILALTWGFGTWFYNSRLFSLAAFIALALSAVQLGAFLEAEPEVYLILLSFASLFGLGGASALKRWRSAKFSLPLFLLVQVSHLVLVALTLIAIAARQFDPSREWNLVSTSFWLLALLFYILSYGIFAFRLFPWLAVAALYPLPFNLMLAFDVDPLPAAVATWGWGLLLALVSEFFRRAQNDRLDLYAFPALSGSLLLTLTAVLIGYEEDISYGFFLVLASSLLYTLLHILRPRIYLWVAALLFGLGAYFSFFVLPFMAETKVFAGYQLLGASLLLLTPDLFLAPDFSADKAWRTPLRAFGAALAFFNMALILPISTGHTGPAAISYGVYTIFFALYALKFNRAMFGYIATASAALAAAFVLRYFELDTWLATLTSLAAIYYIASVFLARKGVPSSWSGLLRYSGLGLAGLVSILAIVTLEVAGGWFELIAASLFGYELFWRRFSLAEAGLQLFFAGGVFLLLREAGVERGYQGLAIALAFLGMDLALHLAYTEERTLARVFRGSGALIVLLNTFDLLFNASEPRVAAICFAVYTLFFLAQAWLYRQPLLGYSSSFYSVLGVIFALQAFDQPKWVVPVTLLAAGYYIAGVYLRKRLLARAQPTVANQPADSGFPWPFILWTSGLAAGLLATIASPLQGDLSAAIPAAVTATMVAIEAFDRRNVWLGFPANALYLIAYFILLLELDVDEPQFFSIATAMLGMLMHYLLTRAGSRTGAFVTGMVSQLVLLSTTYIQFLSTERLVFFFAIFFQALAVLGYGVVIRSRSLVITPLVFLVLSVLTVAYGLLQGILTVMLIGCTGILLLVLGILAVVMRDRIKRIGERFSEWGA